MFYHQGIRKTGGATQLTQSSLASRYYRSCMCWGDILSGTRDV